MTVPSLAKLASPAKASTSAKTSTPAKLLTPTKKATPTKTSSLEKLFNPSKKSTPTITLTPTKQPPSPPATPPTEERPKRPSGWTHIEKLMSVLPEHRRNALLRDYVPGEEPTGLEGYDDAVKRFKFQEKWNIKAARALLKASPASTPQKAHKFSKSVNVPRINVEDATPPSPVERFWNRENGNGSGGGGVEGRNGRIHSRYHSM